MLAKHTHGQRMEHGRVEVEGLLGQVRSAASTAGDRVAGAGVGANAGAAHMRLDAGLERGVQLQPLDGRADDLPDADGAVPAGGREVLPVVAELRGPYRAGTTATLGSFSPTIPGTTRRTMGEHTREPWGGPRCRGCRRGGRISRRACGVNATAPAGARGKIGGRAVHCRNLVGVRVRGAQLLCEEEAAELLHVAGLLEHLDVAGLAEVALELVDVDGVEYLGGGGVDAGNTLAGRPRGRRRAL